MSQPWQLRNQTLDVAGGVIMGVLNVTPDSFSDGGVHASAADAIAGGVAMRDAGAEILDVGGESTRPGAEPVSVGDELERVIPVVEQLANRGMLVSIDTSKPEVARAAIEAGARIVNDVAACSAPGMAELVVETGVGVVLMHMQGTPQNMQQDPRYDDVVTVVAGFLAGRAAHLIELGADPLSIAVDPGIGFGKTVTHNLKLLAGLGQLAAIGYPVVLGASRKSFLGRLTGIESPADRDGVTAVTTALGFERGARVFRVHDVFSSRAALTVAATIVNPELWEEWSPD
ncbi:MAG: dihydropteroate synthase [Actinomycetota bacterium]|nr:dihydropteroate synthase [Actinomycetota bacterium]